MTTIKTNKCGVRHIPGSDAEAKCPVHGPGSNTPIAKMQTVDSNAKKSLNALASRLNPMQKQSHKLVMPHSYGSGPINFPRQHLDDDEWTALIDYIKANPNGLTNKQSRDSIEIQLAAQADPELIARYCTECGGASGSNEMAWDMAALGRPIKDVASIIATIPGATPHDINEHLIKIYAANHSTVALSRLSELAARPGMDKAQMESTGKLIAARSGPDEIVRTCRVCPKLDGNLLWDALLTRRTYSPLHVAKMANTLAARLDPHTPSEQAVFDAIATAPTPHNPRVRSREIDRAIKLLQSKNPALTDSQVAIRLSASLGVYDPVKQPYGPPVGLVDLLVEKAIKDKSAMSAIRANLYASPAIQYGARFSLLKSGGSFDDYLKNGNQAIWEGYDHANPDGVGPPTMRSTVMRDISREAVEWSYNHDGEGLATISLSLMRRLESRILPHADAFEVYQWAEAFYRGGGLHDFCKRVELCSEPGTLAGMVDMAAGGRGGRFSPKGSSLLRPSDFEHAPVVLDVVRYSRTTNANPHTSASLAMDIMQAFKPRNLITDHLIELGQVVDTNTRSDSALRAKMFNVIRRRSRGSV